MRKYKYRDGVTNLSLLFNIQGPSRVLRYTPTASSGVTGVSFGAGAIDPGTTILYLDYLTPHPSQLLSSKCVVPYYDLPRYISSGSTTDVVPFVPRSATRPTRFDFAAATSKVIQSQSLQLNQIPDKLIIYVRDSNAPTASGSTPDRFLPITNITMNWNNMSGMLSSFSQYDLWRASVDAGGLLVEPVKVI